MPCLMYESWKVLELSILGERTKNVHICPGDKVFV